MSYRYTFVQSKAGSPQNKNRVSNTARFEILMYFSPLLSTVTLQGITECLGKQLAFCTPPLHKTAETVFVFKNCLIIASFLAKI